MSKEHAGIIVKHLSTVLECKEFSFDDQNNIELTLDDDMGVIIHYSEEANALVVNMLIAPLLNEDSDILYEILCGNYMWGFTAGGNIGIDRESGLLSLHRLIEISDNALEEASMFEEVFVALVGAARYWRNYLEGVQEPSTSSDSLESIANMVRI